MSDFLDFGAPHLQTWIDSPYSAKPNPYSDRSHDSKTQKKADQNANFQKTRPGDTWYHSMTSPSHRDVPQRKLDPSFLEVRASICVTGFHREAVQQVKNKMDSLMEQPVALESFHIHRLSDLKDGSLLVPKLVMVAVHCPGKKLIDEEGSEGQLDLLYDEVCDLGADVMVVYLGLPRSIYPPFRHMVYHPKMSEILFPTQPLLRELAESNSLITVTEGSEWTNMQKNVLREWMRRPVDHSHQIYKSAECLSSAEWSFSDAEFYSEPDSVHRSKSVPATSVVMENEFQAAEEHHPLAEVSTKKKKKKSRRKQLFRLGRKERREEVPEKRLDLVTLEEDDVELELYNASSNPMGAYNNLDSYSNLSV